jgi:hypothetical protein
MTRALIDRNPEARFTKDYGLFSSLHWKLFKELFTFYTLELNRTQNLHY